MVIDHSVDAPNNPPPATARPQAPYPTRDCFEQLAARLDAEPFTVERADELAAIGVDDGRRAGVATAADVAGSRHARPNARDDR